MNKVSSRQPQALLGWMDSLADPARLRLLRLLERNELGVAELCDVLQLPQSTVSRHLKVLADQRFVRSRRSGTNHLYRTVLDELELPARKLWLLAREQTDTWPAVQQDGLRLVRILRDRQSDSEAFFAGAAAQWDKLRSELYGESFTTAAMLSLLADGAIVADLGCGTGEVSQVLARHVNQVIAIDNSPAMLKAARKRFEDTDNIDLRRGDLAELPIEDGTCDAALMLLVLSYLSDPQPALRESARILKPGGKLVLVDLLPHDRPDFRHEFGQTSMGFDAETMKHLLAACGFADARVQPLPPEAGAKGPALFLANARRN